MTSSTISAPDNSATAATFTATSGSGDSYAAVKAPNPSLYDNETVTASVFLRLNTSTAQSLNLYLMNNGDQGVQIAKSTRAPVTLTSSWQRFDLTGTLQNGLTDLYLQIGGGGTLTGGESIQIWGAQLVIGNAPDPYTPTPTTTTVYATGTTGTLVPTGLNQTYAYDSFGNILQNGSFQSSYTANNQMFGYAYDAAGNLLSDGMNIMTWDAESRMTSAGGATFIYDAEGNRVEKQGTAVTDTVYFGGQPIARYSAGQWTDLIYGPTGLLAEVPGTQIGAPVYRVTDNLGTNVGSLLANGTFVDPVDHTPFGQVFTGNTSDPYLFTGKERDAESGLDYFGARYYASNMGRWMSPDWADKPEAVPYSQLDNPQSLNLYGYVNNNPLSKVDKDGHCLEDACVVEGATAVVAFGALTVSTYLQTPAGQRNLGDAASAAASIVSSAFHSVFSKSDAPTAPAAPAPATSDQPAPSRSGALNAAKKDAGVPTSQQPSKQESVPVTDSNGKQVVVNGQPQTSREYTHTTGDGKTVVIQDHGQGHTFPDGGQVGPHFNVRPPENTRNGTVDGTQPHYPYQ